MSKALELAKFGRETPPTGVVVGDSDAQTLSSKTFSDGPVFSSGAVNAVPYLNASKVFSTSGTFVFDGTNLGIGVASPGYMLHVKGGALAATSADGTVTSTFNYNSLGTITNSVFNIVANNSTRISIAPTTTTLSGSIYIENTNAINELTFTGSEYTNLVSNSTSAFDIGTNAAGPLLLTTNSIERMRILSGGNVGVGTPTPALKLDVNGSIKMSGGTGTALTWDTAIGSQYLKYDSTLDGLILAGYGGLGFRVAGSATNAVTVSSTGNVGIGAAPTAVTGFGINKFLEIGGASVPGIVLRPTGSTSEHSILGAGDGLLIGATGAATATNNVIRFFTSNVNSSNSPTERLRIESNGTIKKLGTNGGLLLMDGNTAGGVKIGAYAANLVTDGYLAFEGYSIEYGRFDSTGKFGIGTPTPLNLLHVASASGDKVEFLRLQSTSGFNAGGGSFIRAGSSGTNSVLFGFDYDTQAFQVQNGSTNTAMLTVSTSGYVGIGTTSLQAKLNINGISATGAVTNISNLNGIRVNGNASDVGVIGITFADGGGGGAAIGLARGGGYDTNIRFYTNPGSTATPGAITERMRLTSDGVLLVNSQVLLYNNSKIQATASSGPTIGTQQTTASEYAAGFWNSSNTDPKNIVAYFAGSAGNQIGGVRANGTTLQFTGSSGNSPLQITSSDIVTISTLQASLSSTNGWINTSYGSIGSSQLLSYANQFFGYNLRGYRSTDGGSTNNNFYTMNAHGSMGFSGIEQDFGGFIRFYTSSTAYQATTANTVVSPTLAMTVKPGGNVGIGTTDPSWRLEVVSPAGIDSPVTIRRDDWQAGEVRLNLALKYAISGYISSGISEYVTDTGYIALNYKSGSSTYAEGLRVSNLGRVGIGTPSPSGPLHVHQDSGGPNCITMSTTFGSGNSYAVNPFIQGVSNGGFSIRDVTNGADRIAIAYSTGNVGINTSYPTFKLHVNGTSSFEDIIKHKRFTTHVYENLNGGAYPFSSDSTARYEIARIAIDYNDWNSVGQTIIEINQIYYSTGGYSKWAVNYGYVQNSRVALLETVGDWSGGTVTIGTPVQISGDVYYLPVYVNVYGYHQVVAKLTTTVSLGPDNSVPGQGQISLLKSPAVVNAGAGSSPLSIPEYSETDFNHKITGRLATSYYAHNWLFGNDRFVQMRGGKATSTGTYSLFTRGSSGAQSSGKVYVQAIYGTPATAGSWEYVISGNKAISLINSNTSIFSGSTPSIYWSGNTLYASNGDASTYYTVIVELHNIGEHWYAAFGDFPGFIS